MHSLLDLIYALTRDQTHNLGALGQHSNQLSYPARSNWKSFKRCIVFLSTLLPRANSSIPFSLMSNVFLNSSIDFLNFVIIYLMSIISTWFFFKCIFSFQFLNFLLTCNYLHLHNQSKHSSFTLMSENFLYWFLEKQERNIDLFHLVIHSLVDSLSLFKKILFIYF